MFKQIEVDGVTYYYDGKNFLDEYFIILEGPILKKVAEVYFCGVDYKKLDAEILFLYIKKLKSFGLNHRAKQVIEYALEKYDTEEFLYRILPIYTSCCREMGLAREAIIRVENDYPHIEYSVALCTSLAAAYCDIKEYDKAIRYARIAYAKQGGGQGYKTELSLVFMRIKKETGKALFEE